MGLTTLRSLSVLLLIGVAMIGCNNADKDKKLISANKGAPPFSTGQANAPQTPTFPAGRQPFPSANSNPGPGAQPSNLPTFPTSPAGNVTPASPTFPPSGGITPLGGNAAPISGPSFPSNSNSFAPSVPAPNPGGFGTLRTTAPTQPATPDSFGNSGPIIAPPKDFK